MQSPAYCIPDVRQSGYSSCRLQSSRRDRSCKDIMHHIYRSPLKSTSSRWQCRCLQPLAARRNASLRLCTEHATRAYDVACLSQTWLEPFRCECDGVEESTFGGVRRRRVERPKEGVPNLGLNLQNKAQVASASRRCRLWWFHSRRVVCDLAGPNNHSLCRFCRCRR